MLAEEALVLGCSGTFPHNLDWIPQDNVLSLLSTISPQTNISQNEIKEVITEFLNSWELIKEKLKPILFQRAQKIAESHRRVRAAAHLRLRGLSVSPYFPPDLLGILCLLPVPKGVAE
ncbi:MAG: helicase, partial [Candidatus Aminicenantes bacterium]|nr:helicase [Candidatus Aminicenantes bacterium]